jgi:hypothetical protein
MKLFILIIAFVCIISGCKKDNKSTVKYPEKVAIGDTANAIIKVIGDTILPGTMHDIDFNNDGIKDLRIVSIYNNEPNSKALILNAFLQKIYLLNLNNNFNVLSKDVLDTLYRTNKWFNTYHYPINSYKNVLYGAHESYKTARNLSKNDTIDKTIFFESGISDTIILTDAIYDSYCCEMAPPDYRIWRGDFGTDSHSLSNLYKDSLSNIGIKLQEREKIWIGWMNIKINEKRLDSNSNKSYYQLVLTRYTLVRVQ